LAAGLKETPIFHLPCTRKGLVCAVPPVLPPEAAKKSLAAERGWAVLTMRFELKHKNERPYVFFILANSVVPSLASIILSIKSTLPFTHFLKALKNLHSFIAVSTIFVYERFATVEN
jgi:hypothetical protein